MKVLVDTSVWVSHFRQSNQVLTTMLVQDRVVCHPFIIGEIACGTPPSPRARTLADLKLLSQTKIATQEELLFLIEQHHLYGKGCGLVDIAILASALITSDTILWTLDKRLKALAQQFDIAFEH